MGYFSDLDIDKQSLDATDGNYSHDYEPDYTNAKLKDNKSLEATLAYASEYMKSDKFAKEWAKFCKGGET